jgi:hypothetical protein
VGILLDLLILVARVVVDEDGLELVGRSGAHSSRVLYGADEHVRTRWSRRHLIIMSSPKIRRYRRWSSCRFRPS